MSVDSPSRHKSGISTATRNGLLLAVLLGASDIVFGVIQLISGGVVPTAVSSASIVAGMVTVAAAVPAWRGATWSIWVIVAVRSIAALTALPAFFVAGVPVEAISLAAATVLITVVAVVLLLQRPRAAL